MCEMSCFELKVTSEKIAQEFCDALKKFFSEIAGDYEYSAINSWIKTISIKNDTVVIDPYNDNAFRYDDANEIFPKLFNFLKKRFPNEKFYFTVKIYSEGIGKIATLKYKSKDDIIINKEYEPVDTQTVLVYRDLGNSINEIAEELKTTPKMVLETIIDEVFDLYENEEMSCEEIADEYGVDTSIIEEIIEENPLD